jgi:hypothetical protein
MGDPLNKEGRTALVRASVHLLSNIRDTFHTEYLGTLPPASNRFNADLVTDAALVILS